MTDAKPPKGPRAYEPTAQERDAAHRYIDRRAKRPPPPLFKVEPNASGGVTISADHSDPGINAALLADSLAVPDLRVAEVLLNQIANLSRTGREVKQDELNGMLALVHALGPRDTTEALLVVQMVSIHNAVAVAARRLAHIETLPQQDSASNMLNKLARTFTAQVEALKRYRSSGEQKVTVQHVTVTAGQAVVGIKQGGGGAHEKSSQSHALGENADSGRADARGPALLSHEQAVPMPVQSTGSEGPERVPDARGKGRRTDG